MSNRIKLHLIIAANPKAYSSEGGMTGGELVGTPEAFAYHLDPKNFPRGVKPGVFYSATFGNNGLINYLPEDENEKEKIRNELLRSFGTPKKINEQQIVVDKIGFIYEPQKKWIQWQFEADGLRCLKEIRNNPNLQHYLISVHKKIVLSQTDWSKNDLHWLLIRQMKRLPKPIENLDSFFIKPLGKKNKNLSALNIRPNAYAMLKKSRIFPKAQYESISQLEDEILVEILSSRSKKLSEYTIHDIFRHELSKKGYWIKDEGNTSNGRFDIAFKDKSNNLKVIEFKIDVANGQTLRQLRKYMRTIENKYKGEKVTGVIIARNCTPTTLKKCKQIGIEFYQYKLILSFPGVFEDIDD